MFLLRFTPLAGGGRERRGGEPSVVSNLINAPAPDDDLSSPAPVTPFKSVGSWRKNLFHDVLAE